MGYFSSMVISLLIAYVSEGHTLNFIITFCEGPSITDYAFLSEIR